MREYKTTKVFVIRKIDTGKLISLGSKCGWSSTTAAKNAFNTHMRHHFRLIFSYDTKSLFDRQSEFTVEEVQ